MQRVTFARNARLASLCLLVLAALACNLSGLGASATPTPAGPFAVISEIVNQVTFSSTEGGPETPAASGQAVPVGSEVKTGGNAKARMDLPQSGDAVRLSQNTWLAVRELGSTSHFYLPAGQIYVVLGGSGTQGAVETPGGSAVTDGQMSVEYYPDDGTGAPLFVVTCLAGTCSANNPFGGVTLAPGQQSEAKGSAGLSGAHPIDANRLADWAANVPEMAQLEEASPTGTPEAPSETPEEGGAVEEPSATPEGEVPPETASETPESETAGAPCVTADEDANVRAGPTTAYVIYGVLREGETAEVVGRDTTATWFVIKFSRAPGGQGWVWGNVVTPCGDHSNLPVLIPPATPTFTPTFTPTITPTVPSPTPNKPTASITADDTDLVEGDCTILRWTATNAKEVYLNGQGIAGETSREVCPTQDTTYTLRVVGFDNSSVESSVTIQVTPDPEADPEP